MVEQSKINIVFLLIFLIIGGSLLYDINNGVTDDILHQNHRSYQNHTNITNNLEVESTIWCKVLKYNDKAHEYPPRRVRSTSIPNKHLTRYQNSRYAIDFNDIYKQPNYAYYISTNGQNKNVCLNCGFYRNDLNEFYRYDPYNINTLTYEDIIQLGNNKIHLVPDDDYGHNTYMASNVVPTSEDFQTIWKLNEKFIRDNYLGKLIFKGCDYDENYYINTINTMKIYIPTGCYYVVFDSTMLPYPWSKHYGIVLDFGYYKHINGTQLEKKLPPWLDCEFFENYQDYIKDRAIDSRFYL